MKVGTDGTLLGAWANVPSEICIPRILDIGTGTGLIALMMAQRYENAVVKAIDIDAGAAQQARENVAQAPFADRITVEEMAIQDMRGETFDAIVCNPPYFIDSLTCPDDKRTMARHASTLTYQELTSAAYRLLTDSGVLSVVIPTECLDSMNTAATIAGFFLKRLCMVKTTERKPAKRVLVAYSKQHPEKNAVADTIIIGSEQYDSMMNDFYLTTSAERGIGRRDVAAVADGVSVSTCNEQAGTLSKEIQ